MLKKFLETFNYHLINNSRIAEKQFKEFSIFEHKSLFFVRSNSSLPNPQPRHHNSHHQQIGKYHQKKIKNNIKYFRPLRLSPSIMTTNKLTPSINSTVNYFGNSFLDRQSERRKDAKWLEELMRSPKSVFILFHIDRPFMNLDETKNALELSKFTYEQIRPFLENSTNNDDKAAACNLLFLGIEYEKSEHGKLMSETDGGEIWSIRSPYSNVDNYYNRDEYKGWFAIETSSFDENGDKVAKLLGEHSGKFFEGNFLRMMAIHDVFESSVIAQVNNT